MIHNSPNDPNGNNPNVYKLMDGYALYGIPIQWNIILSIKWNKVQTCAATWIKVSRPFLRNNQEFYSRIKSIKDRNLGLHKGKQLSYTL